MILSPFMKKIVEDVLSRDILDEDLDFRKAKLAYTLLWPDIQKDTLNIMNTDEDDCFEHTITISHLAEPPTTRVFKLNLQVLKAMYYLNIPFQTACVLVEQIGEME